MDMPTITVPLRTDEHGIIRVGNTRVTLEVILARYEQGNTPEAIHEGFPSVELTDIYAVIAYALAHEDEVQMYLEQRDAEIDKLQKTIEAEMSPEIRAKQAEWRTLIQQRRSDDAL